MIYHKIHSPFKRDEATGQFKYDEFARDEFRFLWDNTWTWTEKVDGTNIRLYPNNASIRGRSDKAQIPPMLLLRLNEIMNTAPWGVPFPTEDFADTEIVLHGEGFGAGIQKGGKYGAEPDFVLFDVQVGNLFLEHSSVVDIATKLGIQVVPIVGIGGLHNLFKFVEDGFKSAWGDFEAEGVVARPTTELLDRRGNRIITKLKGRDFQ